MRTAPRYDWQHQSRGVVGGRMAWYGETADEKFWADHWKIRIRNYLSSDKNDLLQDEIGKILLSQLDRNEPVIDAGCGAGFWVHSLLQYGYQAEGLESSKTLVELLHEIYPELPVNYGNVLSMNCEDNHYGAYLSFSVMAHDMSGPKAYLREAHRVLKPGGKIFVTVPYFGPLRHFKNFFGLDLMPDPLQPFFQYGYSSEEMTAEFQAAGFKNISTHILHVHRLLLEELPLYEWLARHAGGTKVKRAAEILLKGRDGHTLFLQASK